jgi:hypothetical protein
MIFMPNISLIFALFISVVGARVGIDSADQNLVSTRSTVAAKRLCMEVTGKFTWLGKNVEYILNYPYFNAMTKEK